jgi:type II secretory pathway component PulC
LRKIRLPQIKPEKIIEASKGPAGKVKPLSFYLNNTKGRSAFGAAAESEFSAADIDRDLAENINLVGIISGENPQAVIEDKKAAKTYYLNKGQLLGEFQLEDIQEGKVILNYKGRRYGLYL